MTELFLFILGLIVGSFLNVCIYRVPQEQSVIWPGSSCPACKQAIRWHDNIPLFSYLILKGKCRSCQDKISFVYPVVELISGCLWLFLWIKYGLSFEFAAGAVLCSVLLCLSVIDLQIGLIPDKITFPAMVLGLLLSMIAPVLHGEIVWYWGGLQSLIGLLTGGGILLLTAMIGSILFRKEAMGGGDIKLLAMIGAFVGWTDAVFVFFLAPILSLPFALWAKFGSQKETIPFGPFLAMTGAAFYVFGNQILEMISHLYGV